MFHRVKKQLATGALLLLLSTSLSAQWLPRAGNDGFSASEIGLGIPVDLNGDGTVRAYADYKGNHDFDNGGVVRIRQWNGSSWVTLGESNSVELPNSEAEFGRSIKLNAAGNMLAVGTNAGFSDSESYSSISVYQFINNEWSLRGTPILSNQTSLIGTGVEIAISADGNRIVFAEPFHDQGINNGTLAGPNLGIIRAFEWNGSDWSQLGSTLLGTEDRSSLGNHLAFSADGNTIVASDGYQEDITIRTFRWDGQNWNQLGTAIPRSPGFFFLPFADGGVSVSGDGNTLVVGVPSITSDADNGGLVTIYQWSGFSWDTVDELTDSDPYTAFGNSVDMSYDGNTIIVGVPYSRYITPDNYIFRGRARIYTFDGDHYVQVGDDIQGNSTGDHFANSVAISGDGQVVNIATDFSNSNYSRVFAFDGIVDVKNPNQVVETITISPNPASNELLLPADLEPGMLTIYSPTGQQIQSEQIVTPRRILIEKLPRGYYYLVYSGKSGQAYQTSFIKQ